MMSRKSIFDAIKAARGKGFTPDEVPLIDVLLDRLGVPKDAPAGVRRIGPRGLKLIKDFESLQLKAYRDPVGIWTIGYGSTGAHVKPGMVITEAQAEALLLKDLSRFEARVDKAAPNATDNQFAAMVSLAFNVGLGDPVKGIQGFLTSTVLRKHLAGDHMGAASAFAMWNKAGGQVSRGLTRRRAAEAQLYRS